MKFEIESTAYIVESNRIVHEVTVIKQNGDFYTVRFNTGGTLRSGGSDCLQVQRKQRRTVRTGGKRKQGTDPHMIILIKGRR